MTGISSGGGGGYDYVETSFVSDAEEGEELYHLTNNAAYVYTGVQWIEQTVTDHSQLSGVNEGDHRSDQRVSDLAPLQSVNGRTGDVTGLFEASDYTPEADTHSRYTDAEAESAAPVQSINGKTGALEVVAFDEGNRVVRKTKEFSNLFPVGDDPDSGQVSYAWSDKESFNRQVNVSRPDGYEYSIEVNGVEVFSGTGDYSHPVTDPGDTTVKVNNLSNTGGKTITVEFTSTNTLPVKVL